ncbi:hypothetical protein TRAPUB_8698, partial [Trametes pubescens]
GHRPRLPGPNLEVSGYSAPDASVETRITSFGVRVTLPLIPVRNHPDIAYLAVLACQHSSLPDSLVCLYLGKSIKAGTSTLHPVGAFTPVLPHDMRASFVHPLRGTRGGFLCHPSPPEVRDRIITPTVYLVHNSHQPTHGKRLHGRAYERAVRMYVAATQLATVRRPRTLAAFSDLQVACRAPSTSLPLGGAVTLSLADTGEAAHSIMYGKRGGRPASGLVAETVTGALVFAVFFPDKLFEVTKVDVIHARCVLMRAAVIHEYQF